ncbi:caspase family protein [Marinovum sp. 2_MG-2023]|uniref:caspase family protein n=1 Tax=unclassified Marinovum TaxID=2647166 RepID=UPI0026E11411|nr:MULTISPECIES: caspase family protein [unclassified Marinovum]MDO6731708.1 caspase family protein [Marinovum sp. 2_MG-2023]MDO6780960.1 caspase family protein [Marinovum sp. 1_MG-2023]
MRLISLIALIFWALPVWAENRIALVIGNSDYARIGKLANATHDARLISDSLRATGFDVTVLTDLDEDAMGLALDRFAEDAQSADVAAVYFAGHGVQYQRVNYLMPVDANLRSAAAIPREGLSLDQIMQALTPVPVSLIFLDACRNNPFAEQLLAQARAEGRSAAVSRGLAVVQAEGDQLVAFATLPDTVASDGTAGNSPFARALARHISTPDVEVSVMMKRVTADVMQETDGTQRPQQLSQMQREFYFNGAADDPAPRLNTPDPILSVYPLRVAVDDEVAMIADLPAACTPFFFALSPSAKFTPIPRKFFRTFALASGQTRYEISPGSRYGLKVLPEDEKGTNLIGYMCEPPSGTDQTVLKALLREGVQAAQNGVEDGEVSAMGASARFQIRPFEIE